MKVFVILLVVIGTVALAQQSFAWCMENQDWKDAPCYASYQNFSKEKIQNDWAPYYEYKGNEWMEQKKLELMIAIRDGYQEKWYNENDANSNVFEYYYAFYDMGRYQDLYSPHKQLAEGFPFSEIKCKQNLVLVQKRDGSPACVKQSTSEVLRERQWLVCENQPFKRGPPCGAQSSTGKPDRTEYDYTESDAVIIGKEWLTGGILRYEKTVPVIDDTYLSHSVKYWQDIPSEILRAEHAIRGDEFYMNLGKLLVKNEMAYQMQRLGIENTHDDFEIYAGLVDESLPPHIYYDAVVNGTDGKTYRLQGAAHANKVNYYATEELVFHDTKQPFTIQDILTKPQLVTILPRSGFDQSQEPKIVIIHMNDSKVEFFNDSPVTVRIQADGSGDVSKEGELEWIGPILKPNQLGHVMFNKTGLYEWDARVLPEADNPDVWMGHAAGRILVLSDNTNSLPAEDRIKMAGTIIMDSDIPRSGMGMGKSDGLRVYFGDAIYEMLPDAAQYYEDRIKQRIPFDVNVILE